MESRRRSIAADATREYRKERDYMETKRTEELQKVKMIPGSLAVLRVAEALARPSKPIPPDCKRIAVLIENVFDDANYYQVRGKGFLIKQKIARKHLIPIVNDHLQQELKYDRLRSADPIPLEEYLHAVHTGMHSKRPICHCKSGCGTTKCVCRVMGFKCGSDCHPAYYKKHAACKNYK